MIPNSATMGAEFFPGVPSESDLWEIASRWVQSVLEYRSACGMFGSVRAHVFQSPEKNEIHLTEETTFRSAGLPAGETVLSAAVKWIQTQAARRAEHGLTGGGRLEFDDRAGTVYAAKVIETTVVTTAENEQPRRPRRKSSAGIVDKASVA